MSETLAALRPILDLLERMGLTSHNIQVVLGDHYFFAVSPAVPPAPWPKPG